MYTYDSPWNRSQVTQENIESDDDDNSTTTDDDDDDNDIMDMNKAYRQQLQPGERREILALKKFSHITVA